MSLEKERLRCGGLDLGREIGAEVNGGLDLERERERERVIWSRLAMNPALFLFNLHPVLL